MAKLTTKDIRERAKAILEGPPTGMRFTPLWKQISHENPETKESTIFTQVSNLARDEPTSVVKPSRGVYQLTKFAEANSEEPDVIEPKDGEEETDGFCKQDFYPSFADWLRDELEEATIAVSLGGAGLKIKWGTPDVVGVYKPLVDDIYRVPMEVVSAEIKIDPSQSVIALGQSVAYRLFSHKCYLVMPRSIGEDELGRLEALCLILGIGLILFDLDPKLPKYSILSRAQRFAPDMFYVNEFIQRLKAHNRELFDKLFG
jgi:hypothetical protein